MCRSLESRKTSWLRFPRTKHGSESINRKHPKPNQSALGAPDPCQWPPYGVTQEAPRACSAALGSETETMCSNTTHPLSARMRNRLWPNGPQIKPVFVIHMLVKLQQRATASGSLNGRSHILPNFSILAPFSQECSWIVLHTRPEWALACSKLRQHYDQKAHWAMLDKKLGLLGREHSDLYKL